MLDFPSGSSDKIDQAPSCPSPELELSPEVASKQAVFAALRPRCRANAVPKDERLSKVIERIGGGQTYSFDLFLFLPQLSPQLRHHGHFLRRPIFVRFIFGTQVQDIRI